MNATERAINAQGFNRQRQEEEARHHSRMNDIVWRKHLAWRREDVDPADWMNFEDWLDSPEGQAWIDGEAEGETERACTSPYSTSPVIIWH